MSNPTPNRAIVIGAGLGGLSAAIRLAARGWHVSVFEQQGIPGGKAGSESHDGYRFDTGPSLLTMPYVFDELFGEAGERREDHLTFRRLETVCNYFWRDGTTLNAPGFADQLPEAMERALGEPRKNTARYLDYAGRIHEAAADLFLRYSLHDASTYFSKLFFKSLTRLGRIDAFRTLDGSHRKHLKTARAIQLFNRYATYNGSSPYRTPATMAIIPFVEYAHGGYAVEGGIHAISASLEKLARSLGVTFSFNTRVTRIAWEQAGGRRPVRGVILEDQTEVEADIVVSNVDVSVTYPKLLGDEDARQLKRYHALEPSSSGLVFYWGINRSFDSLTVNNIFFSDDYPAEFHALFEERRCPDDPTIYVNITSKVTPDDAPPGCENWFVLVNAPYTDGQDWALESQRIRAVVVERLGRQLGVDLESHIQTESIMTPADIEQRTASYRGALYGISSNSTMAAFARHPNRSRSYPGLYFCGGSAHPGGGMPLVVLSGKIASDLATIDRTRRRI